MLCNFSEAMDPPPRDKLGGDPIEKAGLFEGDIAGVQPAPDSAVKGKKVVNSKSLNSIGGSSNPVSPILVISLA